RGHRDPAVRSHRRDGLHERAGPDLRPAVAARDGVTAARGAGARPRRGRRAGAAAPAQDLKHEGGAPEGTPPYGESWFRVSDPAHVRRLEALRAPGHVELDRLVLGERLEALALDGGEVDEHVLAAFLRNESETLRIVEPLHRTTSHLPTPRIGELPLHRSHAA